MGKMGKFQILGSQKPKMGKKAYSSCLPQWFSFAFGPFAYCFGGSLGQMHMFWAPGQKFFKNLKIGQNWIYSPNPRVENCRTYFSTVKSDQKIFKIFFPPKCFFHEILTEKNFEIFWSLFTVEKCHTFFFGVILSQNKKWPKF